MVRLQSGAMPSDRMSHRLPHTAVALLTIIGRGKRFVDGFPGCALTWQQSLLIHSAVAMAEELARDKLDGCTCMQVAALSRQPVHRHKYPGHRWLRI